MRVIDRMGIQTSGLTILRRIMALPAEPVGHVVQLGIDDTRRGREHFQQRQRARWQIGGAGNWF